MVAPFCWAKSGGENVVGRKAKNRVIDGEYKGKVVGYTSSSFYILLGIFKALNLRMVKSLYWK